MDMETFDQISVPAEVVGAGKWLLKEGAEFVIRLLDGRPAQVVFPAAFVDDVVETAEPSSTGHQGGHVLKDAKLASGLAIKVPLFIGVGEHVRGFHFRAVGFPQHGSDHRQGIAGHQGHGEHQ
jgi:elongation factor P